MSRPRVTAGANTGTRRAGRLALLGVVLALCALVVPDSGVAPARFALVTVHRAGGVDLDQDVLRILAVGSDARPGEDMTRTRGDALQLISIDTATHTASSIGIPRDSWVSIDGYGSDRINDALFDGGPQLLATEVGELLGVSPDYVFVTRFKYFQAMVTDIGGVDVDNPRYFDDSALKPLGFQAGHIHLSGYGALAFARSRHSLPGGDFDRSANQQRVIAGIQRKVASRAGRAGFIEHGVLDVLRYTDTDAGPSELFRIAQAVAQVDPSRLTGCVVTGSFATINGADVVLPDTALARSYGDQVRDDARLEHCASGPARR